MGSSAGIRRFSRLGATNWRLLAEALAALVVASARIKLRPFRKVAAAASQRQRECAKAADDAFLRKVRWAVSLWADRVPWRAVCFQRGLAVHMILRRRGIPSVLHYGVARSAAEGVKAHVWITVAGRAVIGGEEASNFTCLATFPAPEGREGS
jgi:hypothetical protein